jgi:hypothetical protein
MNGQDRGGEPPAESFRFGAVRVAVWNRTQSTRDGRSITMPKIVLDRCYKDANDNWQHTQSLDVNDVPKAILALTKAYEYALENAASRREESAGPNVSTEDIH